MPSGAEPQMQIRMAAASWFRSSGSITKSMTLKSQKEPHIDPMNRNIQTRWASWSPARAFTMPMIAHAYTKAAIE